MKLCYDGNKLKVKKANNGKTEILLKIRDLAPFPECHR